jgi:hypothetical protein
MTIETVRKPNLRDSIREWTPPGIRVLLAISITLGVTSLLLNWPAIPTNAAMIITAVSAFGAHAKREKRIGRDELLAQLITMAVADVYQQQVDSRT